MDGDLVGQPSEPQEEISLTAIFINAFPQYLVMGMTYDEYWNKPVWLTRVYREAWEIKLRNEEAGRHRQGAYFYDALIKVSPMLRPFSKGKVEPGKYMEQPIPVSDKEMKEREANERAENMKRALEKIKLESAINKAKEQREANEVG